MLSFGSFGSGRGTGTGAEPAALRNLRAYWEALRENGALPQRDQIDPRGLGCDLDKVFLVERITRGHARFRLAGHQLHDLMGLDLRGMPLASLFDPLARQALSPLVEEVFDAPSALHMTIEAERGIGRPALRARLQILPLGSEGRSAAMALGILLSEGETGRAPRRFHISTSRLERIVLPPTTATPVRRSVGFDATAPAPQVLARFTKPSAVAPGAPKGPMTRARHPHLRLVVSND